MSGMQQGATWDEKNRALEDAFRKLSIRQFGSTGIPYEFLIPEMGRELLLMTPVPRPKALPAKKALRRLVQSTGTTIKVLDGLPQPVIDALNFKPTALRELKIRLRILHRASGQAVVKKKKGAPPKMQPAKIALVLARHYYGLTGNKPTVPKKDGKAYGPFLGLVKTVFEILDVDAKPASQAEKIARNWKAISAKF